MNRSSTPYAGPARLLPLAWSLVVCLSLRAQGPAPLLSVLPFAGNTADGVDDVYQLQLDGAAATWWFVHPCVTLSAPTPGSPIQATVDALLANAALANLRPITPWSPGSDPWFLSHVTKVLGTVAGAPLIAVPADHVALVQNLSLAASTTYAGAPWNDPLGARAWLQPLTLQTPTPNVANSYRRVWSATCSGWAAANAVGVTNPSGFWGACLADSTKVTDDVSAGQNVFDLNRLIDQCLYAQIADPAIAKYLIMGDGVNPSYKAQLMSAGALLVTLQAVGIHDLSAIPGTIDNGTQTFPSIWMTNPPPPPPPWIRITPKVDLRPGIRTMKAAGNGTWSGSAMFTCPGTLISMAASNIAGPITITLRVGSRTATVAADYEGPGRIRADLPGNLHIPGGVISLTSIANSVGSTTYPPGAISTTLPPFFP